MAPAISAVAVSPESEDVSPKLKASTGLSSSTVIADGSV